MSLRLKNESTTFPPEGLRFEERQLGWKNWINDPTTVWSWDGLVGAIYNLRSQNRARFPKLTLDRAAIRIQISEQNARRIAGMAGAETYLMPSTAPMGVAQSNPTMGQNVNSRTLLAGVGAAVNRVDLLARGAATLLDWFIKENGVPVSHELAESRALRCVECPKNNMEGPDAWFTKPAAALIKKKLAARKELNLTTSVDDKLGICEACLCANHLSVHVPLDVKLKHMTPETRSQLWEACWQINE